MKSIILISFLFLLVFDFNQTKADTNKKIIIEFLCKDKNIHESLVGLIYDIKLIKLYKDDLKIFRGTSEKDGTEKIDKKHQSSDVHRLIYNNKKELAFITIQPVRDRKNLSAIDKIDPKIKTEHINKVGFKYINYNIIDYKTLELTQEGSVEIKEEDLGNYNFSNKPEIRWKRTDVCKKIK